MRRETLRPRPRWQEKVEALGLSFHTDDGIPYWCEDACYAFSAGEIDLLEEVTERLHEICLIAAERLIVGGDLERLAIPEAFRPWIAESWSRRDPDLYGRFDLVFDGSNPPKMLEYNADTPTALLEAAVVQWYWLEEVKPGADQFNSIHERLIAGWAGIRPRMAPDWPVHFAGVTEEPEDRVTLDYMRDVCQQAGLATRQLDISDIGWNGRTFTDLAEAPIHVLFKLYPWEWLLREDFATHLLADKTAFVEPPWKMVLSTKAILPILWEMFPDHPNLLPASFRREDFSGACVEKPFHGREGSGIRCLTGGEGERTDGEPCVWQAFAPLPQFDGRHALVGSWIVGGKPAGLGIRDDLSLVTGNMSLFVPHYFTS
jgi:glutathionylspermidine synthase